MTGAGSACIAATPTGAGRHLIGDRIAGEFVSVRLVRRERYFFAVNASTIEAGMRPRSPIS